MQNLSIELLRTFVAVVDTGTFAAAAQKVLRSESAVVQQMQRLEAQLGKTLFKKQGRNKALTQDGYKTLDYARRLLALNDESWAALTGKGLTGEVRLGAPHDITDSLLPKLLMHVSRSFPELRVAIHMDRSPHLLRALRAGELDLTVATLDANDLRSLTLRTSPTVWMCASDFYPEQAGPLPLIVADELSLFRRMAIEHLDRHGVPWRITYTSPNVVGVKAALKARLGITARTIEMLDADLRIVNEIDLPALPSVSFRLYMSPRSTQAAAARLFDSMQTIRL